MTREELINKAGSKYAEIDPEGVYHTAAIEAAVDVVLAEVLQDAHPGAYCSTMLPSRRAHYGKPDPRIAIIKQQLAQFSFRGDYQTRLAHDIVDALDRGGNTE